MKLVTTSVLIAFLNLPAFLSAAGEADGKAQDILDSTDFKGGLIVHVNCDDGVFTKALAGRTDAMVQGIDTNLAEVQQARRNILADGFDGRVSARWFDGKRLPYADDMVNLLVVNGPSKLSGEEVTRVLTPLGTAWVDGKIFRKPWPDDIDEWTHFLHGADNNAVSRDTRIGLPRSIQWQAGPDWCRSHEQLAGLSAAVTARGRIFYILDEAPLIFIRFPGDWKLIARDAFNGKLLWKKPISNWVDQIRDFRSGPVHLPRRLVAVGDRVYVTRGLDAPVEALDAATGEQIRVYEGTEYTEEIAAANGLLYLVVGTSETRRLGPGVFDEGEPAPSKFRFIAAVDPKTGERKWKKDYSEDEYLLPFSMAVKGSCISYKTTSGVVCLDSSSGEKLWQTAEPTPARRMGFSAPTLVVTDNIVLCADLNVEEKNSGIANGPIEWGIGGRHVRGVPPGRWSELRAYDRKNGNLLWRQPCEQGYHAPVDVFVIGKVVYVGRYYVGYDLHTGEKVERVNRDAPPVSMTHHRCHRKKATVKYVVASESGIELIDFEKGWIGNNSWIRGACLYGVIPANGLLYAPPDPCACSAAVKVSGFFAAAPQRKPHPGMDLPADPVLVKGPAYGKNTAKSRVDTQDWPMYRHDVRRDGAVPTRLGDKVERRWKTQLASTRLTQPVIAASRVVVAGVDNHTVYALDADSGAKQWAFTAGGRIDSSPTIYKRRVLFGSADGWVYCLSLQSGAVEWQFRAAPQAMQVGIESQLESAWPVHGSLLIQNDVLYVTAGRSSYLDGGIVLYRIDPVTGEKISHTIIYHLDPETGEQMIPEKGNSFNMAGTRSDILSGDGEHVFMKHMVFDGKGRETDEQITHLYSPMGMLKNPWFERGFWHYSERHGNGFVRWPDPTSKKIYGRILCKDGDAVYGYGRIELKGGAAGHHTDRYHLFASDKWSLEEFPLIVRAMVAGVDNLAVAGTPDIGQRDSNRKSLRFTNDEEARAAYEGEKGVKFMLISKKDGKTLSEMDLDAMPVFDGMSAAQGKIYVSLGDGSVLCLSP